VQFCFLSFVLESKMGRGGGGYFLGVSFIAEKSVCFATKEIVANLKKPKKSYLLDFQ
jgi:hypothetical protein